MADFSHAVATEVQIDDLVKAMKVDAKDCYATVSGVRQGWVATRKAEQEADLIKKSGVDQTDLDEMLRRDELDALDKKFFQCYQIFYPPDVCPVCVSLVLHDEPQCTRQIHRSETEASGGVATT